MLTLQAAKVLAVIIPNPKESDIKIVNLTEALMLFLYLLMQVLLNINMILSEVMHLKIILNCTLITKA